MKPLFIPDPRAVWLNLSTHAEVVYLEQHLDKIDWRLLSMNPNAIPLIEPDLERFDWYFLSKNPSIISLLRKPEWFRRFEPHLNWQGLCLNPNAVPFLENHLDKIHWDVLSKNPHAMSLLEKHPDKIEWTNLSRNPGAIKLLTENPDKVIGHALCWNPSPETIPLLRTRIETERMNWSGISQHPNALELLEKYPEKIDWFFASYNTKISLLEKNIDKVEWVYVCMNREITHQVIQFLEKHVDKLCARCWSLLSGHPVAVPLLEKYPEHIDWESLSQNPAAVHLLEPDKIDWSELSMNPKAMHLLFHLDTERMKINNAPFTEELMAYVFEPARLMRLSCQYEVDFRDYLQMY